MEEWGILGREGSCTATTRVDARTDVDDPVFAGPVFSNLVFRFLFSESRSGPGRPDLHTRALSRTHARSCARCLVSESDCPGRISFSESDYPGRFRLRIKTRNCCVTHGLREFIYKIHFVRACVCLSRRFCVLIRRQNRF